MRTRDADILILPGLGGSGPDHWQSRWQAKLPTARRVEQDDWDRPVCAAWVSRIRTALQQGDRPAILIAHSLGVIAAVHALLGSPHPRVAGAFLVAPPDEAHIAEIPEIAADFRPFPTAPLPCPSTLVASTDDPYASISATEDAAAAWGSLFLDAGPAGHINVASGHGPWPEGLMSFAGFLKKL